MQRTVVQFVVLLCSLVTCRAIEGQRRISQIKCEQYRCRTQSCMQLCRFKGWPVPLGGMEAWSNEFPHHALLGWNGKEAGKYEFRCGGSLISEYYVLTAAHCPLSYKPPVIVRLGELDPANEFDSQADLEIENITKPFVPQTSKNKIALIRLVKEVIFSDSIRPACLWDSMELNFTSVIATGFGLTQTTSGRMSNKLRKIQLNEVDRPLISDNNDGLYYRSQEGGRDTCQRDPGGPIQVLMNSTDCTFFVVGVTSDYRACGLNYSPVEYTRVASYIDWIESIVWPLSQEEVTTTSDI